MQRLCVDLNVWCAAFLAQAHGRTATAAQSIVKAIRRGRSERGDLGLVVSWGMLNRLALVLQRDLDFSADQASGLVGAIASYADTGPSLSLGGVGVLPIHDSEDRHVLETAWAGKADVLATADLRGFLPKGQSLPATGRVHELRRAGQSLVVAHPFEVAAWLRGTGPESFSNLGPIDISSF